MINLGVKQVVTDPALTLRNEQGTFLVWGPAGQVDKFVCQSGGSIISITPHETRAPRSNYEIEKIAEDAILPERAHAATAR
jgi:hypothetical protein